MKDSANAVFYPQTHEKAVVDSNGVNLQTKLASITTPTYVTAWDGASTPVVANIPAGVTVTYNTTTYTGTLAASASTANKTYLVSTGTTDNYNRYVTQLNGSTYSWQNLGSTEIDLSDYATKAELSELDQEVNGQETTYVSGEQVKMDGTFGAQTGVFRTKYPIPVAHGDTITLSGTTSYMCVYDAEDNVLDYWSGTRTSLSLSASKFANASYFMCTFLNTDKATAYIKVNGVTLFVPKDEVVGLSERMTGAEGEIDELADSVAELQKESEATEKVVDTNLTKINYYNHDEEGNAQDYGTSTVKIPIPSWAQYVLVGSSTNYDYVKWYCYNSSDVEIASMQYNDTGVTRHDFWDQASGEYHYLGAAIPVGTAYIKVHSRNSGVLLSTFAVRFYASSADVPGTFYPNPFTSYYERNIPALREYRKVNDWHFGDPLPNYYFPYLSNKAAEIEAYIKTCAAGCDAFFFITDTHFNTNKNPRQALNCGWSFDMIAYLRKYLRLDTILHGGDLLDSPLCGNFPEDYKQVLGTNKFYLAFGNHEFISLADQNAVNYYTRMLDNGMVFGDENKRWGLVDNPARKTRFIVLSPFGPSPDGESSFVMNELDDDNQYNWFVNTALNIPDGYAAVIVSHTLYVLSGNADSALTTWTGAQRYINAIDGYSGNGKIACVLMGHTHSDRIHISAAGIPYIISQTDRYYSPGGDRDDIGVTRTKGTTTEQHFEVVVINHNAREIKLFAIGSNSRDGIDDNPGSEVSVRTLSNLTNI